MSSALLPPSVSLSWLTKCARCPPMANNHFENPSLSMSCATNIHLRRGFRGHASLLCHTVWGRRGGWGCGGLVGWWGLHTTGTPHGTITCPTW